MGSAKRSTIACAARRRSEGDYDAALSLVWGFTRCPPTMGEGAIKRRLSLIHHASTHRAAHSGGSRKRRGAETAPPMRRAATMRVLSARTDTAGWLGDRREGEQ